MLETPKYFRTAPMVVSGVLLPLRPITIGRRSGLRSRNYIISRWQHFLVFGAGFMDGGDQSRPCMTWSGLRDAAVLFLPLRASCKHLVRYVHMTLVAPPTSDNRRFFVRRPQKNARDI
jgi:hypothetical protein